MTDRQHTLRSEYLFAGKGLHTGLQSQVRLCPASPGTGIVLVRDDLQGAEIPALAENVVQTRRSTTIGCSKATVSTAEHLLGALYALGVDNALVHIGCPELPILDGSAQSYVSAILSDGLAAQDAPRRFITLDSPVELVSGQSRILVTPADEFSLEVTVDFNHPFFGVQRATFGSGDDFARQIAPCRTFCFLEEVEALRAAGLVRGGDLDNAVVVARDAYLCNPPLRFPNECARHKLLDVLGDFALLGAPLKARVEAYRPGHTINTDTALKIRKIWKSSTEA